MNSMFDLSFASLQFTSPLWVRHGGGTARTTNHDKNQMTSDDQKDDSGTNPFETLLDNGDGSSSRREFIGKTAAAGAGAFAIGTAATGSASAAGYSSNDTSSSNSMANMSDVDILNYALTLEQLEATFYTQGQKKFSECQFENSKAAKRLGKSLQFSSYNYFDMIRDHEQTHVKTLTKVIKQLGGTPVSGLQFEFPYKTVNEYIMLAGTFENLGVSAYDGALALLDNPDLQTAGATIATVEARHASYINLLNCKVPFPMPFDQPKTMDQVLAAAGQFIVK